MIGALVLSVTLMVGQMNYSYPSEGYVEVKEAPTFMLRADVPRETPKTRRPVVVVARPQPQPLRLDLKNIELSLPPSPPVVEKKLPLEPTPRSETVYFDFDSFRLRESEKVKLDSLRKDIPYEITGYTCDLGSKEYNDRLALKRAETVKGYLGVSGEVKGKGKCCYSHPTDRSKNRRVEINPKK